MKYPKDYLDEIKLRLKVSQVVGKTVQLKKRGKEFVGLSPFKNEKTPSFTVNDEKEFYHSYNKVPSNLFLLQNIFLIIHYKNYFAMAHNLVESH